MLPNHNTRRSLRHRPPVVAVAAAILALAAGPGPACFGTDRTIDFNRQIRPILSANCYQCHGPDAGARQADLRLDAAEVAYSAGAIVPGQPDQSELWRRVNSADDEVRMPPPEAHKHLTAEQKTLLRQWIVEGARYEKHWAFVPPRRPQVPGVDAAAWARNPLDRFVLRRLDEEGLRPSAEADRFTLIRRVFLDLIGRPPEPHEADAFVNDSRPDAYERWVERLLASNHYGERWARRWLDLARYSDTNGYEKDQPRTMWPYRDWVIDALNADLPFDQFTIEQIAGDMLPDATPQQIIATGFHRNTMINEEGGVDPMEYRFYAQVDRVGTTGTVWLGLSVNCAQCHDHKYDPLEQREFYRLMAFFDQADDRDFDVPDPEIAVRRAELDAQIAAMTADMVKRFTIEPEEAQAGGAPVDDQSPGPADPSGQAVAGGDPILQSFEAWIDDESQKSAAWQVLRPEQLESTLPILTVLGDHSVLASGDFHKSETFYVTCRCELERLTAIRLEMLPHPSLPNGGPGRGSIAAGIEQKGRFLLNKFSLSVDGRDVAIDMATESYAHKENVAAHAVDDDPQSGWANDGRQGQPVSAVFRLAEPLVVRPGTSLTFRMHSEAFYPSGVGHFRLAVTADSRPVSATGHPADIEAILARSPESFDQVDRDRLFQYYLTVSPQLQKEREQIQALRQQKPRFPLGMVLQQRQPEHYRQTHRHHRGEFLQPREAVEPGVFGALHDLSAESAADRLTMARWLVHRENPLVARVTVNRDWAAFFGRGIVSTTNDFGTQGDAPAHPELLDWLAVEFMESGWSRKHVHRLIVTSATYRQSSRVSEEFATLDPANMLLARGPRFRLDAELIRDSVLSMSGLLSDKIGGPSVFPPQPAGVSENAFGPLEWKVSEGEDRYRRGLYTFSKRTAPYAMFTTFDAPSGEVCVARRDRSNTPLQALMMLNDEFLIDAARALASRVCSDADALPRERASKLLRRCLVRPPLGDELDRVVAFYQRQLERYQNGELDASAAAGDEDTARSGEINELAAWTAVARAVLNLDEVITKE